MVTGLRNFSGALRVYKRPQKHAMASTLYESFQKRTTDSRFSSRRELIFCTLASQQAPDTQFFCWICFQRKSNPMAFWRIDYPPLSFEMKNHVNEWPVVFGSSIWLVSFSRDVFFCRARKSFCFLRMRYSRIWKNTFLDGKNHFRKRLTCCFQDLRMAQTIIYCSKICHFVTLLAKKNDNRI